MNKMEINQTIKNLMGLDVSDPMEAENNIKCAFEVEGNVFVSDRPNGNLLVYLDNDDSLSFEIIEKNGTIVDVIVYNN